MGRISINQNYRSKVQVDHMDPLEYVRALFVKTNIPGAINAVINNRILDLNNYSIIAQMAYHAAGTTASRTQNMYVDGFNKFIMHLTWWLSTYRGWSYFTDESGESPDKRAKVPGNFLAVRESLRPFYSTVLATINSELSQEDYYAIVNSLSDAVHTGLLESKEPNEQIERIAKLFPKTNQFSAAQYVNTITHLATSFSHLETLGTFISKQSHEEVRAIHMAMAHFTKTYNSLRVGDAQRDGLMSVFIGGTPEADTLARYASTFENRGFVSALEHQGQISMFDSLIYQTGLNSDFRNTPLGQFVHTNIATTYTPLTQEFPEMYRRERNDEGFRTSEIVTGAYCFRGFYDPDVTEMTDFNTWHALVALLTIKNGYTIDMVMSNPHLIRDFHSVEREYFTGNIHNERIRSAYSWILSKYRMIRDITMFKNMFSQDLNETLTEGYSSISRIPYPFVSDNLHNIMTESVFVDSYKAMMSGINLFLTAHTEACNVIQDILLTHVPKIVPEELVWQRQGKEKNFFVNSKISAQKKKDYEATMQSLSDCPHQAEDIPIYKDYTGSAYAIHLPDGITWENVDQRTLRMLPFRRVNTDGAIDPEGGFPGDRPQHPMHNLDDQGVATASSIERMAIMHGLSKEFMFFSSTDFEFLSLMGRAIRLYDNDDGSLGKYESHFLQTRRYTEHYHGNITRMMVPGGINWLSLSDSHLSPSLSTQYKFDKVGVALEGLGDGHLIPVELLDFIITSIETSMSTEVIGESFARVIFVYDNYNLDNLLKALRINKIKTQVIGGIPVYYNTNNYVVFINNITATPSPDIYIRKKVKPLHMTQYDLRRLRTYSVSDQIVPLEGVEAYNPETHSMSNIYSILSKFYNVYDLASWSYFHMRDQINGNPGSHAANLATHEIANKFLEQLGEPIIGSIDDWYTRTHLHHLFDLEAEISDTPRYQGFPRLRVRSIVNLEHESYENLPFSHVFKIKPSRPMAGVSVAIYEPTDFLLNDFEAIAGMSMTSIKPFTILSIRMGRGARLESYATKNIYSDRNFFDQQTGPDTMTIVVENNPPKVEPPKVDSKPSDSSTKGEPPKADEDEKESDQDDK